MMAALSDSSAVGVATAGFSFLTVLTTSIVGYLTYTMKVKAETAERRLARIEETTGKTLVHVNDQYLVQLRAVSELARIIADGEKATDADRERAVDAERVYNEHRVKQEQARTDEMHKEKRDC